MTDTGAALLAHLNKGSTIGVGFLGVIASSIVYGVTCMQTFQYYRSPRAKTDNRPLFYMVLALWYTIRRLVQQEAHPDAVPCGRILDSLQSSFSIYACYFYVIDNYANPSGLLINNWSIPAVILTNACISFLVKTFFTFRVWRLSGSVYATGTCVIFNLARLATNIYYPARTYVQSRYRGPPCATVDSDLSILRFSFASLLVAEVELEPYGITSMSLEASADIVVSSSLIYYLYSSRTGLSRSDDMITRLIFLTVATGGLTTLFAVANLIAYIAAPTSFYVLFFTFLVAKMDANALLTSLNSRDYVRQGVSSGSIPLSFQTPSERIRGADGGNRIADSETAIECKIEIEAPYVA
ncbi:hypothetical protein BD311DRAFT_798720 [Dichomitus squalens]|uniref:DUF6534 domain-containing protein n=2 Tax=Dichomitus squalens TaxID=114155 RepID=A0A4Q9MIQ8_9APHY|nr:hypothetical protein BD311DRAFT_798720 [Dichomitus squalens]